MSDCDISLINGRSGSYVLVTGAMQFACKSAVVERERFGDLRLN